MSKGAGDRERLCIFRERALTALGALHLETPTWL